MFWLAFTASLAVAAPEPDICETTLVQLGRLVELHEQTDDPALAEALDAALARISKTISLAGSLTPALNQSKTPPETAGQDLAPVGSALASGPSENVYQAIENLRLFGETRLPFRDFLVFRGHSWFEQVENLMTISENPDFFGIDRSELDEVSFTVPEAPGMPLITLLIFLQYKKIDDRILRAVEFLLERGADPNGGDFQNNPVAVAVRAGWIPMLELLFRYRARADIKNPLNGASLLTQTKNPDVIRLLNQELGRAP